MDGASLTFLVENRPARPGLGSEHGLSVLVRRAGRAILFDAGASGLLAANARAMGADLSDVRAVALSHGHYDHTGGLAAALEEVHPQAEVFAHPAALERKYAVRPGRPAQEIGARLSAGARKRVRTSKDPVELVPGVLLSGEIPRRTSFEDTGGPFFLDAEGRRPDPLPDDMSLIVQGGSGPVLLTGCAHAGVVNILRRAAELTGARRFAAVVGGMHLGSAPPERIRKTLEAFRDLGVEAVGPAHCTGAAAAEAFARAYGRACLDCRAGTVLNL